MLSVLEIKRDSPMGGRPTDEQYAQFARSVAKDIEKATQQVIDDKLNPTEWYQRFDSILIDAHTRAVVLGRMRAGDMADENTFDVLLGRAARDRQSPFLIGFVNDLLSNKYRDEEGVLDEQWIQQRAGMYASATRGTANLSWLAVGEPQDLINWVLSPIEHCQDCIEWAAESPYARGFLAIVPGDGSTACLVNCKCHLEDESGNTGFKNPF